MSKKLILCMVFMVWFAGVSGADYQAARKAHKAKDYETAFKEYSKPAKEGHVRAQVWLGRMYEKGRGVERDFGKAMAWYIKAADQGSAVAFFRIGWMYRKGLGVTADNKKAYEWYLKSAKRGYYLGQWNLGVFLKAGRGVQEDRVEAHKWMSLAYKQRSKESFAHWLGDLESSMTYKEIAEAKKRAKEWKRR